LCMIVPSICAHTAEFEVILSAATVKLDMATTG